MSIICQISEKHVIQCPPEPVFSKNCFDTGEFVITLPPNATYSQVYTCRVQTIIAPPTMIRTGGENSNIFNFILPVFLIILGMVVILNLIKKR